jgi:hypothetical protein
LLFAAGLVANVGQQSNLAGTLDGSVQFSLVLSASTGNTAGQDLAALADALSQATGILVVDEINLVCAENANLSSSSDCGTGSTRCGSSGFNLGFYLIVHFDILLYSL